MKTAANQMMPSLLYNVRLNREDRKRLRPHMDNWLKVHAYIKEIEQARAEWPRSNLDELKRMLLLELTDRAFYPRVHITTRLYSRICHWRRIVELKEINTWLAAQRKQV